MSKLDMLQSLMEKKKAKGEGMDDTYKSAKMGVLKDLHKHMSGLMGDDLKGLKKVTVAAPDEEGLEMGLSKAKDMLEESPELEGSESEDEESPEDLQAQIDMLQEKLAAKKMKV